MAESNALKTDLYELTMAAAYFENGRNQKAVFELYCHTMPPNRRFLVACGLEQAVKYILDFRFSSQDIKLIRGLPGFSKVSNDFFRYLKNLRFSGNVWALPEGEVFFGNEPILQIEAPIIEAQLLETYLLSVINIETVVASKAVRIVRAASMDGVPRPVVDFGSRRAHGPEAGILAARAAHIGGCQGTSNVFAGKKFGIPLYGTMAHSWIQAFEKEEESFKQYTKVFPKNAVFLVDTYNVEEAVRRAIRLKRPFQAVRIDSGDLVILSHKVRSLLDQGGLPNVKIVASGNLNEYKILELIRRRATIDIFGVGTDMVVSRDFPVLDLTYKLVQMEDRQGQMTYRPKMSQGKQTIPGRKQIVRLLDRQGFIRQDALMQADEKPFKGGRTLLQPIVKKGKLCYRFPSVSSLRSQLTKRLNSLSTDFFELDGSSRYPVCYSRKLLALKDQTDKENGK